MLILFLLVQCFAITIPTPKSMKDLERLNPQNSILSVILNFILHHSWAIIGMLFILTSTIIIAFIYHNMKSSNLELTFVPEEEIYLEGRKLCLPQNEVLTGTKKYYLSEEFEENSL